MFISSLWCLFPFNVFVWMIHLTDETTQLMGIGFRLFDILLIVRNQSKNGIKYHQGWFLKKIEMAFQIKSTESIIIRK